MSPRDRDSVTDAETPALRPEAHRHNGHAGAHPARPDGYRDAAHEEHDEDPHAFLLGGHDESDGAHDGLPGSGVDDDGVHDGAHDHPRAGRPRPGADTRQGRRAATRRRRRRRTLTVLAVVLVAVVATSAYVIGMPIYRYFHPADYSGSGSGHVVITVHANDDAAAIGTTLQKAGVVASQRAFINAAEKNSQSQNLQPGSYTLRRHMSATSALNLMLSPSSRLNSSIVVTEGATVVDVANRLTAKPCSANPPAGTICGLGLNPSVVNKALADVSALGLPTDFTVDGRTPSSAEGFLFPATYPFDDSTGVTAALQQMVTQFTDQARSTNFTASAQALGLTPYQELIVASIAQAEAKFPQDMPKVARVILNRLKAGMNLQIDATSAYAAKLKGLNPTTTIYSEAQGPYNTYTHAGLPPTPIGNPGATAMNAAAHPAAGDWLYYVNGDAAGNLFFTNSATAFAKAAQTCKVNGWGCG